MVSRLTLGEVLQKAIAKEIEAQQLYRDLNQKMADRAARETMEELVRQEHGHQQLLERYLSGELKGGALKVSQVIDYKIAESFEPAVISSDMRLKDIFLLAASREKRACKSYLSLAQVHPEGEVRRLLEGLASQELAHKQKMEFLFTEVAFPQTDGG